MKKNWFWRMVCIVVVGILLTLVFTAYMERQESEYVYEKIEKMIPGGEGTSEIRAGRRGLILCAGSDWNVRPDSACLRSHDF